MGLRRKQMERRQASDWLYHLLPALFFFLGLSAGLFCARHVSSEVRAELDTYLRDYLSLSGEQGVSVSSVCALMLAYFRGPVLVFLCGLTSIGVLLLPLVTAVFGFFPSYAAGCLAISFGRPGIGLALALFGFRSLVTIPCFFLLAAPSWRAAAALLRVSVGKGHPFSPIHERRWWFRFAAVCLILCLGVWLDLRLSPLLLRTLLAQVF